MRAIDTNIIVRLCVLDDTRQVELAKRLIAEAFLVLPTVLLESIWVLEKGYRLTRNDVNARLVEVLSNANAVVVSRDAIDWSLECYARGADFADALHIALANEVSASRFATIDKSIAKTMTDMPIAIETLS